MIIARNTPPRLEVAVLAALKGLEAPAGSVVAWTTEETAAYIASVLLEKGNPVPTVTVSAGEPHPTVALFFLTCNCELPDRPEPEAPA